MRDLESLATLAIDHGLQIRREPGPGLLESVYEALLAESLRRQGLIVVRQKPIDIRFREIAFADAFRIDLLVEDRLVIEVKSVETLAKVHQKQLLTYLLIEQPLGLLMNFGSATFAGGLRRVVNNHDFASSRLRVNQSRGENMRTLS